MHNGHHRRRGTGTDNATVEGAGVQGSPEAGRAATRRQRGYGAVLMAAGAVWVVAVPLIVGSPAGLTADRVYATAVPAAVVLLLVGVTGVKRRLGGPGQAPSWRAGFAAMWRRLDNVLDTGYDHHRTRGLRDVRSTSTATRLGVLGVRAGCLFVVVASMQIAGADDSVAFRPMLWFGWFLLYAGGAALGTAVVTTDELPRVAGTLLLAGSLLVFQAATMVATGMATEPERFGPVLSLAVSTPLRVTAAAVFWLTFGTAWAWLGWSLWSESTAH